MNIQELIEESLSGNSIVAVEQALCLQPANSDGCVFPPTYLGRNKGDPPMYCISKGDSWSCVTLDSVQSQANRIEPIFCGELAHLVPQHSVAYDFDVPGEDSSVRREVSLMSMGHRIAGAEVRASKELYEKAREALTAYAEAGDPSLLIRLAPTSVIFGAWDSRGMTVDLSKHLPPSLCAKLGRMLASSITGHNPRQLRRGAVYAPPVDYHALGVAEKESAGSDDKDSTRGYANVIVGLDKSPGGVLVDSITHHTALNCVTLRKTMRGVPDAGNRRCFGEYVMALALAGATYPQEYDLRAGCLLVVDPDADESLWRTVRRDGSRTDVSISHADAVAVAEQCVESVFPNGVGGEVHVADKDRMAKDRKAKRK